MAGPAAAGACEGERTTYTIGTDSTFAPFEFRGFEVESESIGFNAALQALSSNQVDGVIAGMGITDERRQIYDFSDPYFTSELQLAVPEGNEEIVAEYLGDASGDGTPEPPSFFEMLGEIMTALLKGLQNTLLVTGIAFTVAMVLGLAIGFTELLYQAQQVDASNVRGINPRIAEGEVVCVIGPSGSGKSTVLRCLNRLEDLPSASARDDGPTGPETAVAGHPLSG